MESIRSRIDIGSPSPPAVTPVRTITETALTAIIELDFAEGIDRKTLKQLRTRFEQLNSQRLARALDSLGPRQRVVLDLLPLIVHLNHPALPGYLDAACPSGLAGYSPDKQVLDAAQRYSRSFRWRSHVKRAPGIDSLFVMGSPGSIAHSGGSDLDVWLCHRPDLDDEALASLRRKATALERWGLDMGVELHIFVFCAGEFRDGHLQQAVDEESSGSAQHALLLDEFYRTGIHLGGKVPLWWLVPAPMEADYRACTQQLLDFRFIRADDYVDFGAVPRIPPGEFVGAGIWQLYKGIDAPWKALLKLLLIESYTDPAQAPLALAFKAAVYRGEVDVDRLDPYILLYRHLDAWLTGLGASERLELVRRSFYLKMALPLSRMESPGRDWRSRLLAELVAEWDWSDAQVRNLDSRHRWRVGEVLRERRIIVNALMHSYRFLSRLAREQRVRAHIQPQDLLLLGRKLYAVFQRKAGKIEMLNPGIAPNLAEENLAVHHRSAQPGSEEGTGWLLFRDLQSPADAAYQPVIKHCASLVELLTWCHCNGLLTSATRLNIQAGSTQLTMDEFRGLIQALEQGLPAPLGPAARMALIAEPRPLRVMLFINVGRDPLEALTEKGLHKLSERHDALGFSGLRDNLVLTLDQVTLNSWHEVSVQRYEAGDTLIQCLKNYLAMLRQDPGTIPPLRVFCFTSGRGSAIARRVEELFADVVQQMFQRPPAPAGLRYVIEMDRRWFVLQFSDDQPRFLALDSYPDLLAHMAQPQGQYAPLVIDRYALQQAPALRAVCAASEPGNVQLFYEVRGSNAGLWLVDECGAVLAWQAPFHGVRALLAPLVRFLSAIAERRQLRGTLREGLPLDIRLMELLRSGGDYQLQPRHLVLEDGGEGYFEIQAMGHQEADQPMQFDLVCDHREFSVLEYGRQLLPAVRHYVRSLRRSGEHYPIYITDLHLPHDLDPRGYQADLQTVQYLAYKLALEAALNGRAVAPD